MPEVETATMRINLTELKTSMHHMHLCPWTELMYHNTTTVLSITTSASTSRLKETPMYVATYIAKHTQYLAARDMNPDITPYYIGQMYVH